MKTNTTLQELNLWSEQDERGQDGWIADIVNNKHQQAVNGIGAEGARALSDALKTNTTLTALDLSCEQEKGRKVDGLQTLSTTNTNKQTMELEQKEQVH